jgi:bis(5'-nucleosidyl)-tetraphosphatase
MALKDELELLEAVFKFDKSGSLVQVDKDKDKSKKYEPPKGGPSKPPKGPSGVGAEGSEPVKYKKPEKWISAGGVVLGGEDDLEHVYIRKPANNYGPWAFAKGRIDEGETQEQAALREVEEEIGIVAKIVPGGYLGSGEGGYSVTHYYLMYAVRDLKRHDAETEKVMLATFTEAMHKFAKGGNDRDIKILSKAMDKIEQIKRAKAGGR